MSDNHHDPADAIDRTLAALRDAAPPEGMEARVADRLRRHGVAAQRDTAAARAWWRGAACGAAAAAVAVGAVLFVQHRPQTPPAGTRVATAVLAASFPIGSAAQAPCAGPAPQRMHGSVASPRVGPPAMEELLAAATAPSKPAPELPLTAQERELVRLARTANPAQLVALGDDAQAKLEAEDEAEFEKFFAPPPPLPEPPAAEENE